MKIKIYFLFICNTFFLLPFLKAQTDSSHILEVFEMDLESLMDLEVGGRGEVGAFGHRLNDKDRVISIHGYTTNEFIKQQEKPGTFDNHYFNVFLGANLGDMVNAEIQLEYEHGGEEIQARYAQVDLKLHELFILRTGKFLVPINTFNEYLYPEYIAKCISRPFVNREIVPVAWAEVGVQLRGSYEVSDKFKPYYAAYLVNGLEGDNGDAIRSMRGNHRDKNNNNKAFGGRLGATMFTGLDVGAGYYNGKYSPDGELGLQILATDVAYSHKNFSVRGGFNMAMQEVSDTLGNISVVQKQGLSIQATYSIFKRYLPVIRYDQIDLGDPANLSQNRSRLYFGFNYLISNTMNAKIAYEMIRNGGVVDSKDDIISLQLSLGF